MKPKKGRVKKVVFILTSMNKGGAQRVVANLANKLSDDFSVTIILLLVPENEFILADSIELLDFSNRNVAKPRQAVYIVRKLRSYFKSIDKQGSVICSFLVTTNIMTLAAGLGLGLPIIISERNDPKKDGRGIVVRLLTYLSYPFSHKIVFQTKYALGQFPKYIRKKGVVIPNPLELEQLSNSLKSASGNKVVSVGRLVKQKNHALLMRAFARVAARDSSKVLYIYGEGPQRHRLESLIGELEMQENIFLPGTVDNVFEHISDASIFVLSSDYEGQSNALLEAMAMGIPCITTNCSGIDELVDGKNGILIEVGDEIGLSEAMMGLMSDSNLKADMGKRARESLMPLSVEAITIKWKKIILS